MPRDKQEWYAENGLSFDCTQCGNCCSGPSGYVWFSEEEGRDMAAHVNMEHGKFLRQFARRINRQWSLSERWNPQVGGYDCVFLHRDEDGRALCGVYEARPMQCRTWPFWPENLKTQRAWKRASVDCPGMQSGERIYPIEEIRIIRDRTPWVKNNNKK